jgi:hypothetical protein
MWCTFGGDVDLLVPDPEREPAAETAVRLLTGRPNHPGTQPKVHQPDTRQGIPGCAFLAVLGVLVGSGLILARRRRIG